MYLKYLLLITTTMFYGPRTPGVSGEGGRDVGREGNVHCGDPEQTRVRAKDAQSVGTRSRLRHNLLWCSAISLQGLSSWNLFLSHILPLVPPGTQSRKQPKPRICVTNHSISVLRFFWNCASSHGLCVSSRCPFSKRFPELCLLWYSCRWYSMDGLHLWEQIIRVKFLV